MRYTRLQIVNKLKEIGWTKRRTRWYAPNRRGYGQFRTLGVDLRAAASLEELTASESLDTPRRKRAEQPQDAGISMSGIQMGN